MKKKRVIFKILCKCFAGILLAAERFFRDSSGSRLILAGNKPGAVQRIHHGNRQQTRVVCYSCHRTDAVLSDANLPAERKPGGKAYRRQAFADEPDECGA